MGSNKKKTGTIIQALGSVFKVLSDGGEIIECHYRGKFRIAGDGNFFPVVGDYVDLISSPDGCLIDKIYPRKNKISRLKVGSRKPKEQVIIANLELCVIISSIDEPPFKPRLVDRMIVSALKGGLTPIIVLNKCDLKCNFNLEFWQKLYEGIGYKFIPTSAITGMGIDTLKNILAGKISVFVGHSGVGKSSLLNKIHPGLGIVTKQVSKATNKGRHSTTSITMHPIDNDAFVADTPGLRELGLWQIDKRQLGWYFEEFRPFNERCKFRNCLHKDEPDCGIKAAVNEKLISDVRYESYMRILESLPDKLY